MSSGWEINGIECLRVDWINYFEAEQPTHENMKHFANEWVMVLAS